MSALETLIAETLADPLAAARAAAARGRPVIGLTGEDLPIELVYATGAVPVRLPAPPGLATPLADRFLESGFQPAHRAIAQQWLEGAFDFMSAVLFSRANDSAQRLYYYLGELQRTERAGGPRPLLFDLAKVARRSSLAHTERSLQRLASELEVASERLPAALECANRRRRLWSALGAARRGTAPPPGEWAARLLRIGGQCDAEQFDAATAMALGREWPRWTGARLLLAGSAPPDERLHLAVAAAGGRVVQEWGEGSLDALAVLPPVTADPISALAQYYHELNYGPRMWADYTDKLAARASAARADAVLLWLIEEDEALAWHVPLVRQRLEAQGLPLLCLTRQRWDAAPDSLAPIGAFVRTLEVRR